MQLLIEAIRDTIEADDCIQFDEDIFDISDILIEDEYVQSETENFQDSNDTIPQYQSE